MKKKDVIKKKVVEKKTVKKKVVDKNFVENKDIIKKISIYKNFSVSELVNKTAKKVDTMISEGAPIIKGEKSYTIGKITLKKTRVESVRWLFWFVSLFLDPFKYTCKLDDETLIFSVTLFSMNKECKKMFNTLEREAKQRAVNQWVVHLDS